jgi:hypothetical protein
LPDTREQVGRVRASCGAIARGQGSRKELAQFGRQPFLAFSLESLYETRTRNDHDVVRSSDFRRAGCERFAKFPLYAVPRNSVTDSPGNRETEPHSIVLLAIVPIAVKGVDNERSRSGATSLSVGRVEIAGAGQASAACHAVVVSRRLVPGPSAANDTAMPKVACDPAPCGA